MSSPVGHTCNLERLINDELYSLVNLQQADTTSPQGHLLTCGSIFLRNHRTLHARAMSCLPRTLSAHLCLWGSRLKKSLTSSRPSPVTDEVRNTGARESVCMWRAHVKTSSLLLTWTRAHRSILSTLAWHAQTTSCLDTHQSIALCFINRARASKTSRQKVRRCRSPCRASS